MKKTSSLFVRNIIFGIEDSLVSTVGLLAGIATANESARTILSTGIIYIVVEGFSMAVGSFLSEESTQEFEKGTDVSHVGPFIGGVTMFVSFFVAGFIPVAPYLFFSGSIAVLYSILVSLIFLAGVGFVHARVSKVTALPRVVRIVLLGGFAIVIGVLVGHVFGVS